MNSTRLVVISYVATFLPAEAWHIYRQVTGIQAFRNVVVCRRRKLSEQFPYPDLTKLQPPMYRGLWRAARRLAGRQPSLTPTEVGQLLKLRRDTDAKLVHIYLGNEAMRALPYLRREMVPKIVSFHGADLSRGFDSADFKRLDLSVNLFLCRSRSLACELESRGCRPEKIRIHRTGVPVASYPSGRSEPGQQIRLLQACRFIGKKGIDCSIKAVKTLRERGVDCSLTLAGDGPELEALRRLAKELNLGRDVAFVGFLDQTKLRQEMESSHLFLHPSRVTSAGDREGIPNSLLEAMAAGLPVIATAHSGIPEAIADGTEGLLTPENDPVAVADAVVRAASPESWRAMSLAAYRRVAAEFSTESAAKALEAVYEEACQTC